MSSTTPSRTRSSRCGGKRAAAATVLDPRAAAVTAGAVWALPVLLLAGTHVPLLIVQQNAQLTCAAVLCASAVVLFLRRDRVEWGWMR